MFNYFKEFGTREHFYSEYRHAPQLGHKRLRLYCPVNYPSAKASRLVTLLGYDWLVDIPLPEEGGYSLSLSGNAPQPDSSRGLWYMSLLLTKIMPPKPICSLEQSSLTVLLLKGVPYRFRCGHNYIQQKHINFVFAFIPPL